MTKICFKCRRRKRIDLFYAHAYMADGHLNKCKACTRKDVMAYRKSHPEECKRRRRAWMASRPDLVAAMRKRHAAKYPGKTRARSAINLAVRHGKVSRGSCESCGTNRSVEAHHVDYRRPLAVLWLCVPCHKAEHAGGLA